MTVTKLIKWVFIGAAFAGAGAYLYQRMNQKKEKKLFETKQLERRQIMQVINTTGTLEAKGTLNIGSLVNGIVEKLYFEENQPVKKGDLLAKVDDGRGDTNVKYAEGLLKQAEATLAYQNAFYERQKKMCAANQISQNEFDAAKQGYDSALAQVVAQKAYYEQNLLEFNNKKITSPIDGVIIKKNVSLREAVNNFSPPTILYTIAEDIRKMNIELEVDETDIGLVKIGQEAKLYFDTYPHKSFYGKISEISSAPIDNGVGVSYKVTIKIDNKKLLLKPGMTVRARIVVGHKENTFAIPGYLFSLNKKLLKLVAKQKKLEYKPLQPEKRKAFKKSRKTKDNPIKTIWIFKDNAFEQIPIEIGITDNAFFEIVSGMDGTEQVVIDVEEPDAMTKLYQQLFGVKMGNKS